MRKQLLPGLHHLCLAMLSLVVVLLLSNILPNDTAITNESRRFTERLETLQFLLAFLIPLILYRYVRIARAFAVVAIPGALHYGSVSLVLLVATTAFLSAYGPGVWNGARSKIPVWSSIVAVVCIYAVVFWPRLNGRLDLFHEGEQLAPLVQFSQGAIPYKEIWIQHGLIKSLLLPYIGTQLHSPTVEGVRFIERVAEPLGHVAFFLLCLSVFYHRRTAALWLFLVTFGTGFWISLRPAALFLSLFFHCVLLERFLSGQRNGLRRFAVAAGFSTGIAALVSFDFGLYAIAGSILWFICCFAQPVLLPRALLIRQWAPAFVIGLLIALMPVAGWLLAQGGFSSALLAAYRQVSTQMAIWGLPFPSFARSNAFSSTIDNGALFYLTPMVYFLAMLFLLRERNSVTRLKAVLILCFAVPMFQSALGRSDYGHWIDSASLFWILLLLPLDAALASLRQASFVPILPLSVGLAGVVLMVQVTNPFGSIVEKLEKRKSVWASEFAQRPSALATAPLERLGAIAIAKEQYQPLQEVLTVLNQTAASGCLYDMSNQPALYFLSNRQPAHRFFVPVYAATEAEQQQIIDGIESCKPEVVVITGNGPFDAIDGVSTRVRVPLLFEYLDQRYRQRKLVGGMELGFRDG